MEDAALQATLGQLCEEALYRVEPRTGRWREMECEARMPAEPGPHLGVFVDGVIVEDHMHRLVGRHAGIDRVQEADELLMSVFLHIPPDYGAIKNVERGEQGSCAVALVIMGHGAQPPFLEWQSRLGPVERLNLAFLVE